MAGTLIDVLERRAQRQGDSEAVWFQGESLSHALLWQGLNRCAALLRRQGLRPRDPVLICLPNGTAFFQALYGVQRAGGIPVPVDPGSGPQRRAAVAKHAGARLRIEEEWLGPADWADEDPAADFPALGPDDIAFIQYTSGSTGAPKGVLLTHRNLLANLDQLIAGMRITAADVFVSWLPLSHDMGLILMSMVPMYLGARLVLLPVSLTHASRWLGAIQEHRGSFTAAPDFAYRYCLRYLKQPERFDLSSLRVALNAAEPVRASTVRYFEQRFGLRHVMVPGYGLAEASVGVATAVPGQPLEQNDAGCVCVGPPFPDMQVRIQDGEILIRGPSVTQGYHRDPQASKALQAGEGFIRTGDLGHLDAQGRLFVTGRKKDIIIQAGRNIAPREVEEIMDRMEFVRLSAALAIDRGGAEGEQVHVLAEMARSAGDLAPRAAELVRCFHAHFGFRPGRVVLLAPKSIPRTPNGKLMRARLKQDYLDDSLARKDRILYPRPFA